jgi:hypothetical protein
MRPSSGERSASLSGLQPIATRDGGLAEVAWAAGVGGLAR